MSYPPELARADRLLSADELRQKYRNEHPQYLIAHWQHEVEGGYTLRGYWDWVQAQIEEEP
jgi:hypothetical protein